MTLDLIDYSYEKSVKPLFSEESDDFQKQQESEFYRVANSCLADLIPTLKKDYLEDKSVIKPDKIWFKEQSLADQEVFSKRTRY